MICSLPNKLVICLTFEAPLLSLTEGRSSSLLKYNPSHLMFASLMIADLRSALSIVTAATIEFFGNEAIFALTLIKYALNDFVFPMQRFCLILTQLL